MAVADKPRELYTQVHRKLAGYFRVGGASPRRSPTQEALSIPSEKVDGALAAG